MKKFIILALALTMTYRAEAQIYCCQPEQQNNNKLLWVAGAVLLGAAAGAGCGYAAGHSGKKGCGCNKRCPVVPVTTTLIDPPGECACSDCLCTKTACDLTFTFNPITYAFGTTGVATSPFHYTINSQFFATTPLGCTILGDVFSFSGAYNPDTSGLTVTDDTARSVSVATACCGAYQIGFDIDMVILGGKLLTSLEVDLTGVTLTSSCGINESIPVPGLSPNFSDTIPDLATYTGQVVFPFSFQPAECQIGGPI